jgi:hypothetical protein
VVTTISTLAAGYNLPEHHTQDQRQVDCHDAGSYTTRQDNAMNLQEDALKLLVYIFTRLKRINVW